MKFETLKKRRVLYALLGIILFIGVFSIFIIKNTFSRYKNTESINIAKGTINYTLGDINIVAFYVKGDNGYSEVSTVPESGYVLNETQSYCKSGGILQDVTIHYDISTKTIDVAPYTTGKMKCYLYFDAN